MTSRERLGRPLGQQPGEVEGLVELVGTDEGRHRLGGLGPRLGDGHPVGAVLVEDGAPAAVDVVHLGLVPHRLVLELAGHHRVVAVDLAGGRALALLDDLVAQRLLLVRPWATSTRKPSTPRSSQKRSTSSNMSPTSGLRQSRSGWVESKRWRYHCAVLDAGPGRTAEDGPPVVGRQRPVGGRALAEHVARPLRAARSGGQRGLEPDVLVRGVVGHQVDDDAQVQLVRPRDQRVGVVERAEQRVDVAVVGDVVPVVVLGRGVERRDPQGVDTEVAQVGQSRGDAREVADAVAVAVGEAADVDLVDDGVAPPRGPVDDWIVQISHATHSFQPPGRAVNPTGAARRRGPGPPRSRCAPPSRRPAGPRRTAWRP